MSKPLFVVQLNVNPEIEPKWNDWYNTVHLPEVMEASPSIVRATRYQKLAGTGDFKYAAVYEFDTERGLREFMNSERLAQMSAQYNRDYGHLSNRSNYAYLPFITRTRSE